MDSTTTAAIIVLPVASFLLVFAFLWWCLFPSNEEKKVKESKSCASPEPWIALTASREESDAATPSFDLEHVGKAAEAQPIEGEHKNSPIREVRAFRYNRWMAGKRRNVKREKQTLDGDMDADIDVARSVDNEELTMDGDCVENRRSPSRVIRKLFQSSEVNQVKHSEEIPHVFSSGVNIDDEANHPDDELTIGDFAGDDMDGTLASRDVYTTTG